MNCLADTAPLEKDFQYNYKADNGQIMVQVLQVYIPNFTEIKP